MDTNQFPTENWALDSLGPDKVGKYQSLSSVRRVYSLLKVCVVQCLKQVLKKKQRINQMTTVTANENCHDFSGNEVLLTLSNTSFGHPVHYKYFGLPKTGSRITLRWAKQ